MNEMDEDKVNYGISSKKARMIASRRTGEFTVEGLRVSGGVLENVGQEIVNTITFGSPVGSEEYVLSFESIINSRAIPDVERGAYVYSYTSRIAIVTSGNAWLDVELA